MFGVCVTPGLQGDAPAAKSNVQAGSVFSAAGLQCCSAAVGSWSRMPSDGTPGTVRL